MTSRGCRKEFRCSIPFRCRYTVDEEQRNHRYVKSGLNDLPVFGYVIQQRIIIGVKDARNRSSFVKT